MYYQSDFLRDLGLLGVTARLKRLSDGLNTDIKALYRSQGVDLEPGWHLVLLLLQRRRSVSVGELADVLHLSQPAMTRMLQRMHAKGYLEVGVDQEDGRRKVVRLSDLARWRLPVFERIWAAGEAAVGEILYQNNAFLRHLEAFETHVDAKSFLERATAHLEEDREGSLP